MQTHIVQVQSHGEHAGVLGGHAMLVSREKGEGRQEKKNSATVVGHMEWESSRNMSYLYKNSMRRERHAEERRDLDIRKHHMELKEVTCPKKNGHSPHNICYVCPFLSANIHAWCMGKSSSKTFHNNPPQQ